MQDINGTPIAIGDTVLVECTLSADANPPENQIILSPPAKPDGARNPKFTVLGSQVQKGTLPTP